MRNKSILRAALVCIAGGLAFAQQDDLPDLPPGFNPTPDRPAEAGPEPPAKTEPKEDEPKTGWQEIQALMKDLDAPERPTREAAAGRLGEIAKEKKNVASEVKMKLQAQFASWLEKYRAVRYAAAMNARSAGGVDLGAKRKEAMDLFKKKQMEAMRRVVEEMWKAFYPDTRGAEAEPAVKEASDRVREIEGYWRRFDDLKETADQALRRIQLEQDEDLLVSVMPAGDQQVMRANRSCKPELQEEEYRCIFITNQYRVMMGKNALRIDVKLCKAARGHSKDMAELGFFDHISPVPGKRTHQDRARREGTSCVSENIAMSGPSGESAFWAWFSSTKGHHENMLGNHSKIGVGNYKNHWTENF